MAVQYTLKTYPQGMGREVYRVLTICGDQTLADLCRVMMDAFDFYDEHLYEFCMNNRMYEDYNIQAMPMEDFGDAGPSAAEVTLDSLHLVKGQKFSLHYDFGDDWMFPITVQKIEEVKRGVPASVIKSKGEVEQYPDYEDEEDEEGGGEDGEE